MPDSDWGERRAIARHRARRRWIVGLAAALLASPFALDAVARHYLNSGGTMRPNGGFPLWIPLAYWAVVIAIALFGVVRLYHTSDEFERRRLIDAFAASGLLLGLFVPPAYFVGTMPSVIMVWLVALMTGLGVYARPRVTP